ncbi:hypothetical protein D6D17_07449 [Aureobasidium pullulans]|uniref:Histone H2A/H2B/H3 domain-containing protein n=1 Tax=Aureobasidium pullulans TaxID=5580 RepID=A0A4S8YQ90_AURPU|nr:hypothetical protein D6D20_10105 [Aureobasidium pullulans]THW96083.1 hypothetical protein D6D17_07449 [Aureobasidium pullulans]
MSLTRPRTTVPASKRLLKIIPKKNPPKKNAPKSSKRKKDEGPRLYNLSGKGNLLANKAPRFVLLANTKKGGTNALSEIRYYQKTTGTLIPVLRSSKLVREIA